ncbi:MAG: sugar nucleotide-binding protein [Planctomycetota bacterium]
MRALITGLNGTLAPHVKAALERGGHAVVGWERAAVAPEDEAACAAHLEEVSPDAVFHLGMGGEGWAARLAGFCHEHGKRFVFTSTAMVFANEPDGPHRVGDERTADEDYGKYKIRCEDAIAAASPSAVVVRIGWQIGDERGGNHMFEHLSKQHEADGQIGASARWTPACSFMADTAAALMELAERGEPGVYHADSNAVSALPFDEIVRRLSAKTGAGWRVAANEDFVRDQRLLDERVSIAALDGRL